MNSLRHKAMLAAALAVLVGVTGCSRAEDEPATSTEASPSEEVSSAPADELRLGYFANVTHASAIIGVDKGLFEAELGDTKLTTQTFNAGPDVIGALLGGSIDISFIGPGPTISGSPSPTATRCASSPARPRAARSWSYATASTARKTPPLGNTQDVALKKWLSEEGIEKDTAEAVTEQTWDWVRCWTRRGR